MTAYNVELPVLVDDDGQISSSYGVDVIPTAVIIDDRGRIAKSRIGITTEAELAEILAGLN